MHEYFFPKIYEIPRRSAARKPCVDFAAAKYSSVISFHPYPCSYPCRDPHLQRPTINTQKCVCQSRIMGQSYITRIKEYFCRPHHFNFGPNMALSYV
jgi:hypothetical protein